MSDKETATDTPVEVPISRYASQAKSLSDDIKESDGKIKTIRERLDEIVESFEENDAVNDLIGQLALARENLKRRIMGNTEYVNLAEKLANARAGQKESKLLLSEFLLGYFAQTKERQIELGTKDAREVQLRAKLGKPKDFQMSVFKEADQS